MNRPTVVLASICSAVLLSACMQLGLNFKHKTPKHASKLPVFTRQDSLLGSNLPKRAAFDVTHYAIDVSIDPLTKSIKGSVETDFFYLDNTIKEIQLDLDTPLFVDSITSSQGTITYRREGKALFLTLNSFESRQQVTVFYHGVPKPANRPPWEGGLVWKKTSTGTDWCGVSCEGEGAQVWLPVKVWLGDEPDSADMKFTVPKGLMAISNGELVGTEHAAATSTYHWKTRYPINTYNITFYVSDYRLIERSYKSITDAQLQQQFYVLPQNVEKAKVHFLKTDSVLQVYEKMFGPYAWQNEPYKLVESPYEGMEHQTAIAYGSGYRNMGPLRDYIIVHETAHEWWGNALSVADFSDVWLHEGFATYSEAVYVEYFGSYKKYLNYLSTIYFTIGNKKAVCGPKGVYYWNYKDGDLYMKGAATLHALRSQLQNDALFFDIISTFYKSNIGKIVTTEQFIALVNEKSGKNFQPLFDQFLHNRASIVLNYKLVLDAKTKRYSMQYRGERIVPGFEPIIKVKQGNSTLEIVLSNVTKSIVLPFGADVPVQVNADNFYLELQKE